VSRAAKLALFGGGALVFACAACLVIALLPLLPFQHQSARQRWEQRGLRHYELDARWMNGLGSDQHLRVEVRDNQAVAGVNLDTGQALSHGELIAISNYVVIDTLFEIIAELTRPAADWHNQIARYHPLLAQWFSPCAAPLPQVRYDAEYGYPTDFYYRGYPCIATLRSRTRAKMQIERFRPLP
jgi:hypothetical protein